MTADAIKTMKLYSAVERIHLELAAEGYGRDAALPLEVLTRHDQLHYFGTQAVEEAIDAIRPPRDGRVLDVGAGFGGPARDVAALEIPLGRLSQRHEVVLLPVDDPADSYLPAMGRVQFRSADGDALTIDTDSRSGRDAYRGRWISRRDALGHMARKLGIPVIPLPTNEDVHQSLVRGLRLRARELVR